MSPTSAVANSDPNSHGSGTPPRRARTAPTTAAAKVAAAAPMREATEGGDRDAPGACSFIAPRSHLGVGLKSGQCRCVPSPREHLRAAGRVGAEGAGVGGSFFAQ